MVSKEGDAGMKAIRTCTLVLVLVGFLAACQPGPKGQVPHELHPYVWGSLGLSAGSYGRLFSSAPPTYPPCETSCSTELPSGCSVFTISKGDRVFFGGNDDYVNPDQYYWVEPGKGEDYGVVWIGTPDNVQQGVNEVGLAYDANGLPEVAMNPHRERIPWSGGTTSPQMHILHECATVEEVIEWVQIHQVYPRMNDQKQFADASGDAVLISPGTDGELVFTRKPQGDGYLVSTNFNVTNPEHGFGYPCWRYETAQEMLGQLVEGSGEVTARDAAGVLDAVHQGGGTSWTIESLVADLPNGVIYLYFFHQFDRPVVLNVADELAHPRAPGPLSALFPDDVQEEAARRYQRIQAGANRCRWVGMAWAAGVLVCLVLLIALSLGTRRESEASRAMLFWVPVVIVLGPLGFLVWLIAGRSRQLGAWQASLLESAGDVTPTTLAFMAYLALALFVPAVLGSDLVQLALILGLPLAVGWTAFQGPLLALATKRGYLRTLWERLPHALVAANLGMAGVSAVAGPLTNASVRTCSFFPSPGWAMGILWAIAVLGALLSGLLLFIYQSWAVRRSFQAWRILASGEGQVRSPTWRTLWWWILISYAALLGGLVANAFLQ